VSSGASGPSERSFLDHPLTVILLSAVLAVCLLRNSILPLGAIPEDGNGDYGVMVWNLWFVNEALTRFHNPYWTNWIYFPVGTWLSKHTLAAGFFPLTFLVQKLSFGSPFYALYTYRIAIGLCFALALALTHLLLRSLGFSRGVAMVASVGFALCRYAQLHSPHIHHLAGAALLPGVSLAVLRLVRAPRRSRALLLAALLGYGVYLTEFIAFIDVALLVVFLAALTRRATRAELLALGRRLGLRTILLSLLVYTLVIAPFLGAWIRDVANPPKERQSSVTSANLLGFVVPDPDFTPLYGRVFATWNAHVRRGVAGRETFLGFPLLLLAVLGLVGSRSRVGGLGAALFLVFLVLSLGPELKILEENTEFPLPYALLREIPPFEMARSPVRFVLVAVFGAALLAAEGLARLRSGILARFGPKWAHALVGLVLVWSVAEVHHTLPRLEPFRIPPALSLLAPGPVLNVPISAWDGYAVFLQTFHGHPIATGFVSRGEEEPTDHVKDLDRLLETDTVAFALRLKEEGITNILVGPRALPRTVRQVQDLPVNVVFMRERHP
jgi:hypothetical protein